MLPARERMARRTFGDQDLAATIADMTLGGFRDMLPANRLPNVEDGCE